MAAGNADILTAQQGVVDMSMASSVDMDSARLMLSYCFLLILIVICSAEVHGSLPCAGPGSYRIGTVCVLAGWHKRHLNQALVSLRLVLFVAYNCCRCSLCVVTWLQLDFVH